jgi:hypothetical protein
MSKFVTGKKKDEVDYRNVGILVTTRRNAEMQDQDRSKCQHLA